MLAQFTPPPFAPFSGRPNQMCQSSGPGGFTCTTLGPGSGIFPALLFVVVIFWLAGIFLAVYATRDMDRRGQSGCLWGALVFFGGWIGIIFWLIQRRQYPVQGE